MDPLPHHLTNDRVPTDRQSDRSTEASFNLKENRTLCHVCRRPKSILKQLVQCVGCKKQYHPSCHTPAVVDKDVQSECWSCSRCVKQRKQNLSALALKPALWNSRATPAGVEAGSAKGIKTPSNRPQRCIECKMVFMANSEDMRCSRCIGKEENNAAHANSRANAKCFAEKLVDGFAGAVGTTGNRKDPVTKLTVAAIHPTAWSTVETSGEESDKSLAPQSSLSRNDKSSGPLSFAKSPFNDQSRNQNISMEIGPSASEAAGSIAERHARLADVVEDHIHQAFTDEQIAQSLAEPGRTGRSEMPGKAAQVKWQGHQPLAPFQTPKDRAAHNTTSQALQETAQPSIPDGAIPSAYQGRRPRRKFEEIERLYKCGWHGCDKAYGALKHLNHHVEYHSHGRKRTAAAFRDDVHPIKTYGNDTNKVHKSRKSKKRELSPGTSSSDDTGQPVQKRPRLREPTAADLSQTVPEQLTSRKAKRSTIPITPVFGLLPDTTRNITAPLKPIISFASDSKKLPSSSIPAELSPSRNLQATIIISDSEVESTGYQPQMFNSLRTVQKSPDKEPSFQTPVRTVLRDQFQTNMSPDKSEQQMKTALYEHTGDSSSTIRLSKGSSTIASTARRTFTNIPRPQVPEKAKSLDNEEQGKRNGCVSDGRRVSLSMATVELNVRALEPALTTNKFNRYPRRTAGLEKNRGLLPEMQSTEEPSSSDEHSICESYMDEEDIEPNGTKDHREPRKPGRTVFKSDSRALLQEYETGNPRKAPPVSRRSIEKCYACARANRTCDGVQPKCGRCVQTKSGCITVEDSSKAIELEFNTETCSYCAKGNRECNGAKPICNWCTKHHKSCSFRGQSKAKPIDRTRKDHQTAATCYNPASPPIGSAPARKRISIKTKLETEAYLDSFLLTPQEPSRSMHESLLSQNWANINPRINWPAELCEEDIKHKRLATERPAYKNHWGKVLLDVVVQERISKGWQKHQVVDMNVPGKRDISARSFEGTGEDLLMEDGDEREECLIRAGKSTNRLFGLPEEIEPIVVEGKLMFQDTIIDDHEAKRSSPKRFCIV